MSTRSGISLTDRAAEHVRKFLERHGSSVGLRVAVKPTGCSGFQYVVEPAAAIGEQDRVFESHGIQVVVDDLSLNYLNGTQLDYRRAGLNESFQFDNPNVSATCGCGESFNVKETATQN